MKNLIPALILALSPALLTPSARAAEWKHATFAVAGGGWVSVDYQIQRLGSDRRLWATPIWVNVTLPAGTDCRAQATGDFLRIRYDYPAASSKVARPVHVGNPLYVTLEPAATASGCRYTGRAQDLVVRDPSYPYADGKPQFSVIFKFKHHGTPLTLAQDHSPFFQVQYDER